MDHVPAPPPLDPAARARAARPSSAAPTATTPLGPARLVPPAAISRPGDARRRLALMLAGIGLLVVILVALVARGRDGDAAARRDGDAAARRDVDAAAQAAQAAQRQGDAARRAP